MTNIDFKRVADCALGSINSVLARWLPGGKKQGSEWVALNPTRADKTAGSFSVNLASGKWSDFASGDRGGDLVSLVAYLEGVSQPEAAKIITDFLNLQVAPDKQQPPSKQAKSKTAKQVWTAILPVPEAGLAACPDRHPKLGKPSAVWEYIDSAERLLMKICRFDFEASEGRGKSYRPMTWCKNREGKEAWRWQQPDNNRPLYRLDRLTNDKSKLVLLCEGEKASDAAITLFPDAVCMTWPGGSKAISKVDFKPLKGRQVWYWPDADTPGEQSVPVLQKALQAVGVKSFQAINIQAFADCSPSNQNGKASLNDGGTWPEKADAADALAMGWTAAHIKLLDQSGKLFKKQAPDVEPSGKFQGFKVTDKAVFYFDSKTKSYKHLCTRLEQMAWARDVESRGWSHLLRFTDRDDIEKEWVASARLFATEGGSEVVRELVDRGLGVSVTRNKRAKLLEYLASLNPSERVRLVYKAGWHKDAFMLPSGAVGGSAEVLHYYSEDNRRCKMKQAGTLDQWQKQVAGYAVGNPLIAFTMSVAFVAPLLEIMGTETSGFHLYSDSSDGKTTALIAASSILGQGEEYGYKWRATDNAIEGIAAAHSDCLLVLDEIGQAYDRLIGETVMMLGNGLGKARANERGGVVSGQHQWRLAYLSSGEQTLAGKMADAGLKTRAGMEVRLLNIPVRLHYDTDDQAQCHGVFNELHGFATGAGLSDQLKAASNKYYGTAFPAFITRLVESLDREKLIGWIASQQRDFAKHHVSEHAGGQVRRAADKFALVGAAGELATRWGVTGWQKGEALRAADNVFQRWLRDRGGEGNLEEKQIIDNVTLLIEKYGESRFTRWESEDAKIDEHAPRSMEKWGYRKTTSETDPLLRTSTENFYYVFTEAFKAELCKGYDPVRVARLLRDRGALVCREEKGRSRLQYSARLPGMGKSPTKCYLIKPAALYADH